MLEVIGWGSPDRRADQVQWVDLGRTFAGDARKLADIIRLSVVRDDELGSRTMLYVPPRRAGGRGLVSVSARASAGQVNRMVAVAAGLHLSGELRYSLYQDGVLLGPTRERHRRANVFAQCFLRAAVRTQAS